MEQDLQQHVPQFLAQRRPVTVLNGLQQFVRLLDQIPAQRTMGLLGVPGQPPGDRSRSITATAANNSAPGGAGVPITAAPAANSRAAAGSDRSAATTTTDR